MIRIKHPGKILTYHSHTSTPIFDPNQNYSVLNFRKDHFYNYNPKYIIRENDLIKTRKVSYSLRLDHIMKFLEKQFEEDKFLLKKPKEVLFIGKCTAGKSSLINQILDIKAARISKKGFFNFYETKIDFGQIVDSPSYGNGDFSYKIKHQNKKLLKNYITFSTRLCKIYFVIDLSVGMDITDRIMFNYAKHLNLPIQLVFNKVDKVPSDLVYTKVQTFSQPFSLYEDIVQSEVLITSCKTGYGIKELNKSVKHTLQENLTRQIFYKAGKVSYLPQGDIEGSDQMEKQLLLDERIRNQDFQSIKTLLLK